MDRSRDKKLLGYYRTTRGSKKEGRKVGGQLPSYWTFGKYDGIGVLEAPNDEAAMQFGLKVGSLGIIRTTTFRAITEEEIASVVDKPG